MCFRECVKNFHTREMDKKEKECLRNCSGKYTDMMNRVYQRYQEIRTAGRVVHLLSCFPVFVVHLLCLLSCRLKERQYGGVIITCLPFPAERFTFIHGLYLYMHLPLLWKGRVAFEFHTTCISTASNASSNCTPHRSPPLNPHWGSCVLS